MKIQQTFLEFMLMNILPGKIFKSVNKKIVNTLFSIKQVKHMGGGGGGIGRDQISNITP